MMTPPICGTFNGSRATASANTVFTRIIPPFCGRSGSPQKRFLVDPATTYPAGATTATAGTPNWNTPSDAYAHLTDIFYSSLTTAHSLYVLRPLNWTYFASAVSSNTTAITLAADPGLYATKFKYPLPSASALPNLADNAIGAGDYCAYQLLDGTWRADLVASGTGTTPVMTTGTPNVTGAGIAQYSPFFFFGAVGDTDPNSGIIQPLFNSNVNTTNEKFQSAGGLLGLVSALHRGDPLLFVSSNGTDAGILQMLSGFYSTEF